jgi:hypothetical protein
MFINLFAYSEEGNIYSFSKALCAFKEIKEGNIYKFLRHNVPLKKLKKETFRIYSN